ncbi:Protein OS-9 [Gonapodya sp. JEL0774]|nr:Protein OS-9 [Gonapodya sp. JEL0774]
MPAGGTSGQLYACKLPHVRPEDEVEARKEREKALAAPDRSDTAQELREALKAVAGMKKCLLYGNGWFSYEYCHLSHVRQFHQPDITTGDNSREVEYYLGIDQSAPVADKLRRQNLLDGGKVKKGEVEKRSSTAVAEVKIGGDGRKYLSVLYGDGTMCDLTKRPRMVEVQVRIGFHMREGENVYRNDTVHRETATCSYILVIHTTRLCSISAFNPVEVTQVQAVTCSMVVTDKYYELARPSAGLGDSTAVQGIVGKEGVQTTENRKKNGLFSAAESAVLFPHLFPSAESGSSGSGKHGEASATSDTTSNGGLHLESEEDEEGVREMDNISGLKHVKILGPGGGTVQLTLEELMKLVAEQLGQHLHGGLGKEDQESDESAQSSDEGDGGREGDGPKFMRVEGDDGSVVLKVVAKKRKAGQEEDASAENAREGGE